MAARIVSLNRATELRPSRHDASRLTGIGKLPVAGGLLAARTGLAGDRIGDLARHGGADKALYAYAGEDLHRWSRLLGRDLPPGSFGENLTTWDLDVSVALIGERWVIHGAAGDVHVEVTQPRTPCATFKSWMGERLWGRKFEAAHAPGAYLRVLVPGVIAADDPITVVWRPDHGIAVRDCSLMASADTMRRLIQSGFPLTASMRGFAERKVAAGERAEAAALTMPGRADDH